MTHRHDRCPECGVDAGKVCRDDNDRTAVEPCDGRPLLPLHDSVERTKPSRQNHHGVARSKAQKNRHKKGLELPRYVPCLHCGASCKLIGGAVVSGSTYCPAMECRRAKDREDGRRRRAKAREAARVPKVRTCIICGADASAHGVGWRNEATCSGECRAARWRQRLDAQNERRRLAREAAPATVLCHWCGVTLPGYGRRPGQRPCCGAGDCLRARATDKRRAMGIPRRVMRERS